MPFTPFHFGPCAVIALPLRKRLDPPVFLLSNVFVDLEPLTIMVLGLDRPEHGLAHTLAGGIVIGTAGGFFCWHFLRRFLSAAMAALGLEYEPDLRRMIVSCVLGIWFHVALDSVLYPEIRPFWPFSPSPLHKIISLPAMYGLTALCFIPAFLLYLRGKKR